MRVNEIIETNSIGTMPTTDYVKGIYAAAAENGMDALDVEAVKRQMVLAPNGEVDIMKTMQKALQVFQDPKFKKMIRDLNNLISRAEQFKESATAGATSAANVGIGIAYPNKRGKTAKNPDGTVKNALDDKKGNLITGGSIGKQRFIKR